MLQVNLSQEEFLPPSPEEVLLAQITQQLQQLKADPQSAFDTKNFQYHTLVKNLHLLKEEEVPTRNTYKGTGEGEIFIYAKKGKPAHRIHNISFDWKGEQELDQNVYCGYFSRY